MAVLQVINPERGFAMTTPQELQLPRVIDNTSGTQPPTDSTHAHTQVYAQGSDFRQTINDFMATVADTASKYTPHLELFDHNGGGDNNFFTHHPSPEDQTSAVKKLDGEISPLLPQDEQDTLKNIHNHIVNG